MRPAMCPNLEKGIGQELLGSLRVMEEPFAARKERRLDAKTPQSINDLRVIAGDFIRILTKIEGQSEKLLSLRELHAAYRTAHVSRQGGKTGGSPAGSIEAS